jgi:hypothetical protein
MTAFYTPLPLAAVIAGAVGDQGHNLTTQWQEPSADREDRWPPYIRRQSWLIQNRITGLYFPADGEQWVAQPELAMSCMWMDRIVDLVRDASHLFPDVADLQLVLMTFYCDPKTFPRGWFADV